MRIVIGDKSYGPAQLEKAMEEIGVYPVELHCCGPREWWAEVNGIEGDWATGPFLALCDAAKRAGYEVKEGR